MNKYENSTAATKAAVALNKATLLAFAIEHFTFCEVEYSGSGDAGNSNFVDVLVKPEYKDEPKTPELIEVAFVESKWVRDEGGAYVYTLEEKNISFESAVSEFTDQVITATGHDGFEQNDGGGGKLIFDLNKGAINLEHYENVFTTEDYEHEI